MINEEMTKPFKPEQAVIVYKKDSNYYLETHDIDQVDNKFVWKEGKPFSKDQLKDLSIALGDKSFQPMEIKGLMPENLLYFQQSFFDKTIVWYLPPAKRMLHFKKELKLNSGIVSLPGLIFAVTGKNLTVVALKGKTKPTLKGKLFKAPFHNIHCNGEVCMGNISEHASKNVLEDEMTRWERRFFNSYFSHFLDEKVTSKGFNLQVLFKQLMKSNKPFPETALVPSLFKTVEGLIKKLKK